VIKIVIVPRVLESDKEGGSRGRFFVQHEGSAQIESVAQETPTPGGLRLEIKTLLNRYLGQDLSVVIYQYDQEESERGVAVASALLPGVPVVVTGKRQQPYRSSRHWDCFKNFTGKVLHAFVPPWYEPEEPPILIRGIDLDNYALPDIE
jgi:hypothetical protein